ncbi:A-kinase anchor protein 9 isoform X3 [Esox lucius]|uniref:A-kinase anchor protein 9 isoform X3 n=1 Tax=Esox lucius TaxID=8010 RepID=UPI001477638B|nr:A-kinase anchor protein 9 isoform X3 [Esox lucius]
MFHMSLTKLCSTTLAEYRQRKANADGQKKQKKKKKRREADDDPDGGGTGKEDAEQELDKSVEEESGSGGGVGGGGGEPVPSTTEFGFARTLRSGETVRHDQTYTIEPDSEVSTTAEDYSSEVNGCHEMTEMETCKEFIWEEVDPVQKEVRSGRVEVMEEELAAKTLALEELSRELEEIRAAFGTDGVQQLQDFEAALKQRDGIITQLTANLQQSRKEKDEVMREFLEMTEQSQKLHIQFQQLQAGETLRNTSHSSTAQDLLQAKQQLVQYQQLLEEMNNQVRGHQERSEEQLQRISQLQHRLDEAEMGGRSTGESFAQRLNEKDLLIAEQERIVKAHEHSLAQLREELAHVGRGAGETFAQTVNEKDLLISTQTAIIMEHERTLNMLKVELAQVGRMTEEAFAQKLNEKALLIAEQERVMSERDSSLHQIKEELTASEKRFNNLNLQMTAKAQELESCKNDLDNCKRDLEFFKGELDKSRVELESHKGELDSCRVELEGSKGELDSCRVELEGSKGELDSCRVELEGSKDELEACRSELSVSRQKERMSSNEIQQLMGIVEDLQKRCHQGSLSESETLQRMEEDSVHRLDHLRAELDEMYGEQIVQMKQELRLQHSAVLEQLTKQHHEELDLLRAQKSSTSPKVVIELKGKIAELQQRLQEAQMLYEKGRQELTLVAQEKLSLEGQVNDLLQDLHSARFQMEQASQNFAVYESHQGELQRLQETVDSLKAQLVAAAEVAEDIEAKHESETTNYKIKLEMMEREKDAVLDRMAESQEAELERLRTHLLFSHEEELIALRENLQRESQLNAENLLNEASIRHGRALEELRNGYEEDRDELLHQIDALKDDLKMALHSSKAEELLVQLKELQVEAEELRKGGEERVRLEMEIQTLLKKNELLENKSNENEKAWENKWTEQEYENKVLIETNSAMKDEVASKMEKIMSLTIEKEQKQRQVKELQDQIEMQRNTFSFAEKNFEVNYQELKEEYTCLVEVKAQLEDRNLKDTLVYESKLANLQSQIQELMENKETSKMQDKSVDTCSALLEKDTTEQMEKLKVALIEKEELAVRLSKVTEQLTVTEGELDELEGELRQVKRENKGIITVNETMEEELERLQETLKERKGEMELQRQGEEGGEASQSQAKLQQGGLPDQSVAPACTIDNPHVQIESLKGEVDALRSTLRVAEMELDRLRHTPEAQHQSQTLALSAAPSLVSTVGEGPVERSSAVKPLASGSDRRKTQQRRGKKKRQTSAQSKEKIETEEVTNRNKKSGGATAAAERDEQALMESPVPSSSKQRTSEENTTGGFHAHTQAEGVGKQGKTVDGMARQTNLVATREMQDGDCQAKEHLECRLQLEAQRISLSQIHAAQLELLCEQTEEAVCLKEGKDDIKSSKYQNVVQVVSDECEQIILSFAKVFGEEFLQCLHHTDVKDWEIQCSEKEESKDPSAVLQDAKETYRDLRQLKERIEQEHSRLVHLQALLKADVIKFVEMQQAYDNLKLSSEEEIASLRRHMDSAVVSPHNIKDLRETTSHSASSHDTEDIQKLSADVQQQQVQLQESHMQEVERLRAYYQQQAKETEERYATELSVLQQRLLEVTAAQFRFSPADAGQLDARTGEEDEAGLKWVVDDAFLEGVDAELYGPARSMGLTGQLQTLRRALYQKYLQEVASLKEQHRAELVLLREEKEKENKEEEGKEEVGSQAKQDPEVINGGVRSIQEPSPGGQGGQDRRTQERVEEEIAKVIVQMSVEFAQQSELARIAKLARETTSAVQTQSEEGEEGMEEEQPTPRSSLTKEISLEEVQQMFNEEKERLERELDERTTELRRIKKQLLRGLSGFEQMGFSSDGDGETERKESEMKERTELKSQVSQTEKRTGEQEEGREGHQEVRRKMGGLSLGGTDGSSCPDHQVITTERNLLRKANESLRQVLSDVLKTTAAAEETIGCHVEGLLGPPSSSRRPAWQRTESEPFRPASGPAGDASTGGSCQGSETGVDDVSLWSGETETDEGLEISQLGTTDSHSLLPGAELQLENEEYLMNISSRLQAAVEKLLVAITETTNQLEHARVTQTELMRESFRYNQEIGDLLRRQEELQDRLAEEGRAREQLALELHRAEGLIDGYTGERAALEDKVRQKEELQQSLELELQVTSSRLHELEQERLQIQEEREILSRQQEAMREHAGPRELRLVEAAVVAAPEADLLEETEKLMAEKVEVQRQAEKESLDLLHQVKTLEAELEEQVNRVIELENARKTESGDLLQQIQALEKQLDKNRRFLDEQAIDREHERDVFQQEIFKLEQQLKASQKQQPGSEQRSREVEQLNEQLREKADWCSELLLASEQLQREVFERDEEIDKLEGRIRELEQALLASTKAVEDKRQHVSVSDPDDSILKAQLQTEREALDRKEKEICNLEEQLEQFREELENKSEEVQQLHMQLEIQRKALSTQQQDLETKDRLLQVMEEKDREIALLNEQMAKLQHTETSPDNQEIDRKEELLRELESQMDCMRSEQQRLKRNSEEELEQLNAVIDKLQEELANIERKHSSETDEELKGQLESQFGGPSQEEYDEIRQKMDLATKELNAIKGEHGSLLEKYRHLESQLESQVGRPSKEEYDEMRQKMDLATKELNAIKGEHGSFLEKYRHLERQLESQVGRPSKEEYDDIRQKLDVATKELNAIKGEHGSLLEKYRHLESQLESQVGRPSKEEFDEMRQKMDLATKELNAIKGEHGSLLEKYRHLESQLESQVGRPSKEEYDEMRQKMDVATKELNAIEGEHCSLLEKCRHLESQLESQVGHPRKEEYEEIRQKLDVATKELNAIKGEHGSLLEKYRHLESQLESQVGRPSNEEYDEMRQKMDVATKELNAIKGEHGSLLEKYRHLESQLETQVGHPSKEEYDEMRQKMDLATKELNAIKGEHGSLLEKCRHLESQLESQVGRPSKDEYDEMRQKLDLATKELNTIKAEHCSLLDRYRHLQESRLALVECEKEQSDNAAMELQDALREKTAAFVVVQAQVQALEQSATSKVEELSLHIQELEACVKEKDTELTNCRFLVERAQEDADELQRKVQNLEDKLRDSVAAVLVSQAQLGAVQHESHQSHESKIQRTKESGHQDPLVEIEVLDFGLKEMSQLAGVQRAKHGSTGKVVLLTEKLRELEVGLSGMQKDQELQKQLLSSSEEEVVEYEQRLVVLMDLLNQMRASKPGGQQRLFTPAEISRDNDSAVSEILKELQEARDETSSTMEQLNNYREISSELQLKLKAKEVIIVKLQEDIQRVSVGGEERVSELQLKLKEVKEEAAATKEELNSYRERCDKLQELLQEREMTIAHLKGELYQVQASSEGDRSSASNLLQELQEVRDEAAAAKELLNCFRECSEKLQNDLQVRDLSIAQLQEELQQLRVALAKTAESTSAQSPVSPASPSPQLQQQAPPSHPKKKGGKPQDYRQGAKEKMLAASNQTSFDKSSSQTSGFNASQHLHCADAGTQTEMVTYQMSGHARRLDTRSVSEDEDVEEMIEEYQEKIVQMQELHAAEILDMEARHIAESEALKREAHMLEEECKVLKTIIEKLQHSHEVVSRPERPTGLHFKDGYTSDSSSDWSQRTGCDLPNLQQEFRTTPEGARKESDDALPDRIKNLLREVHQEGMQVLSLSELPIPEGQADTAGPLHHAQGWPNEREALLATVESLKALIGQMQTHSRETQTSDWRGELLGAVQQVFVRERSVLKRALYTELDQLDTTDAIIHLNELEHRLAEQDAHHRDAMGILQAADRNSLLTEVRQLRDQLEDVQAQEPDREARSIQGVQGTHTLQQADRVQLEEMKAELAQTKLELETTLKTQHKHLKELDTLRTEVSKKAAEMDTLTDRLAEEQKKAREQQWTFEKEKCKSDRKTELEREELEDLKLALEEEQGRVAQLTITLNQERQSISQLSLRSEQELSRLQTQASQLQVQLESERARAQELSSALGREKELRQHSSSREGGHEEEGAERGADKLDGRMRSSEALLEELQRELDEKHSQVVHLLNEVEAQKLAVVQREEELTAAAQGSREDREALQEAQGELEDLREQLRESVERLEREVQRGRWLEQEKERLQEGMARLGEGPQQQPDSQNQQGQPTDRTRDWVLQQKPNDTLTVPTHTASPLQASGTGNIALLHEHKHSDKVLAKLQIIAARTRSLVSQDPGRLTTEVDAEGLSWLQTNVDEVITMLQQSPVLPTAPEGVALLAGGQSSSLTERLLRQNAELTGFVSRLTEEKNDLRNQVLRLEDELRRYRQAGLGSGDSSNRRGALDQQQEAAGALFTSEREAWTRERSRLEKGLRLAQAEVTHLRGEIRTESLRDMTGREGDNAPLKRMYGRYLRSESFRKALIYQKKYLLLLLGGFQECEEATLSLIARMGGRPARCSLESPGRRGLTRFRSAVRVSIALSRMHFLVKRWHKATGMSSTTSGNMNRNGLGQSPGNEVRTDSPYLHPGSVEVYGERRGASRGRTGRDSPRSALSSVQHRFNTAGDPGPMTCSHLQNYDPDRALTDYISRLEALQRRLGSVQSGTSSYAQLHFGIRR